EARPRLAEIRAPIERPVLAARGRAETGVEDAGIFWRDPDVAAVGERRETADLHVLPRRAAIGAPEQAHADREEDGAGTRRGHAQRVAVPHAFGVGVAVDPALQVWPFGELEQAGGTVVPVLAAVDRAHHTAHLEGRVHVVGARGVHGKSHHATG